MNKLQLEFLGKLIGLVETGDILSVDPCLLRKEGEEYGLDLTLDYLLNGQKLYVKIGIADHINHKYLMTFEMERHFGQRTIHTPEWKPI